AAVGGKVYAIGGKYGSTKLNINEEYDPAVNTWTTKTIMPTARSGLSAAAVGGKLYVIGGDAGTKQQNEEYNPETNTWATKAAMPTARYYLSATAVGGKIYVIGGSYPDRSTNEEYDPAVDAWLTRSDMPTARYRLAAAAVGGKLYAIGGYNGSYLNINEEYDPGVTQKFIGLAPNTQYDFKAKAMDFIGTETAETITVSTYTLAYSSGPALFSDIYTSSIAVAWSTGTASLGYNGPGVTYLIQASSLASFNAISGSSETLNIYATVEGLETNILYHFRVKALNSVNVWSDYTVIGSTYTNVMKPGAPANPFNAVYFSSVDVSWLSNGNPENVEYRVQASTAADYTGDIRGSYATWVSELSDIVVSLDGCTTYYFRVQARNGGLIGTEFEELGSTKTLVYCDIGLRVYDGTEIVAIACQPTYCQGDAIPPLRIHKNGINYGIPLTDPDDPKASKLRIQSVDGIKAFRKY
ncbi:MAG: hypothetical protein L6420_12180, partial [Elusimicrobia bacterium]|nr:hypothetical protein [Elusimicrobiota bacterium]